MMQRVPGWRQARQVAWVKYLANSAHVLGLYCSLDAPKNLMCDALYRPPQFRALQNNASIIESGANIDQRLKFDPLFGRIPICTPQIILFAPIIQEGGLAVGVHFPAAGKEIATDIYDDFDHGLMLGQHFSYLLRGGTFVKEVNRHRVTRPQR